MQIVSWLVWSDIPPYHHWFSRKLTWKQSQKYCQLQETKSLSAAAEYAIKVGKLL
jgi:hypothetical protein